MNGNKNPNDAKNLVKSSDLVEFYLNLAGKFKILSLEDPFDPEDAEGYK